MSIGKGRFHLSFSDIKEFTKALATTYLGEKNKRCWVLVSKKDSLIVVQPSVSTIGLNVLILRTETVEEEKIQKIKELFIREGISIIFSEYIRRPTESQGFTVGFKKDDNFIKALTAFYLSRKKNRCRVLIPKEGPLLIQPSVSTPELNTLVFEDFGSIVGKQKEEIIKSISSLKQIECDSIDSPFKTLNF